MDLDLSTVKGIRFKEIIVADSVSIYRSSRETTDSPRSSLPDSPTPSGPLTIVSFISEPKPEGGGGEGQTSYGHRVSPRFRDGLFLDSREKGVSLPMVHISDNIDCMGTRLDSNVLCELSTGKEYVIHQGIYQEVRKIVPETELPQVAPLHQEQQHIGYILLGFKNVDKNFSQVMLDTWKDWTGARYIYMYLPDDLGLRRISLYRRQVPDDLNIFTYLVVVECHGITDKDKEIRLIDFAQRMRLERLTGYISVYTGTKMERQSPRTPYELDDADFMAKDNKADISGSLFLDSIIQRNSRM